MAIKKALVVYSGSVEELHAGDTVGGGLPTGGTAGQILAKIDAVDNNAEWIDNYTTQVKLYVKNNTGSTINKGNVVYISGADGNNPLIAKAQANADATSATVVGLLETTLAQGDHGYVIVIGELRDIDTSSAIAGDPMWLSPTTAGAIVFGVANEPVAPSHTVYLGTVIRAHAINGAVDIKISNGWELDELHDVLITNPQQNDVLTRVGALWKNMPASGGGGFSNLEIITESTTWNVPAGIAKAKVTVIGGGGGGSGNKTPSVNCGAFGGNGGVAIAMLTGLSGSYTITIGAGGAGGDGGAGTSIGGNGGNTSFGTLLSATGGTGANNSTAGLSGTGTVTSGDVIRSGAKSHPLPYEVAGTGQDRNNAPAVAYSKTAEFGAGMGGDAGGLISATAYAGGGGIGGAVIIEY